MLILAILAAMIVTLYALHQHDSWTAWDVLAVVPTTVLVIALITIPLNRASTHAEIARFHTIQDTATAGRQNDRPLEGAAFRLKISEANQWLASTKYWNTTFMDIWYPDSINELEPIR